MNIQDKKARLNDSPRMIREEHSSKNENLHISTNHAASEPDNLNSQNKKRNIIRKILISGCILMGLYAILWIIGYTSFHQYITVCGSYPYYSVRKNGFEGLVKKHNLLGIDYYQEIIPCEYEAVFHSNVESKQGYNPQNLPVIVRATNNKIAIASTSGFFYTYFKYDEVGYETATFWAVFDKHDPYGRQFGDFYIAPALENNKWRLIDNKGTPLTDAVYDEIEPPYDGFKIKARIGRKWTSLDAEDLYKVKLNGGFYSSNVSVETRSSSMNSSIGTDKIIKISDYIKVGTTWVCTSKSIIGYEIKSYFAFLANNKVLWLLETLNGNIFPVGLGNISKENNTYKLSYLASYPPHKNISMYYGDNNIDFYITIDKKANLSISSKSSDPFLFDEKTYNLAKNKKHFKPSSSLVDQIWGTDNGDKASITFINEYEAIIDEDSYSRTVLYFCTNYEKQSGYIAIKSGDNLSDENLIGSWKAELKEIYLEELNIYTNAYSSEMRLHREGLDETSEQEVIPVDCTIV